MKGTPSCGRRFDCPSFFFLPGSMPTRPGSPADPSHPQVSRGPGTEDVPGPLAFEETIPPCQSPAIRKG